MNVEVRETSNSEPCDHAHTVDMILSSVADLVT